MEPNSTQPVNDVVPHIVADIANAVASRSNQPGSDRTARSQAAAGAIGDFQPADAIEAMIAGHCVMFHKLIVDSVHDTLRDQDQTTRRATRAGIVAMDRAFGDNLVRLARYRAASRAGVDTDAEEPFAETDIADRIRRHQPATQAPEEGSQADPPDNDWRAAATIPAGLNRQARREFNRQARKRPGNATAHPAVSANRNESAAQASVTAAD